MLTEGNLHHPCKDTCSGYAQGFDAGVDFEQTKSSKIMCHGDNCYEDGCGSCGGYGYLIERMKCQCGTEYWIRPGNYTYYEGKQFHTQDGLLITCHTDKPFTCAKCPN